MRKLLRITALILVTLLVTSAACAEYGYITGKKARGYGAPDLSGKGVKLKRYTAVEVLDKTDTLAKISLRGKEGYIAIADLTVTDPDAVISAVVTKQAKAYSLPDTGRKGTSVRTGTELNVLFYANGWALVEKDGVTAWMRVKNLAEQVIFTAKKIDAVCVVSELPLMSAPYSFGRKLAALHENDAVTVTGISEVWAQLEIDGIVCYCDIRGLKEASQVWTEERIFGSGYENDKMIFLYLTKIMGLNTAAACGILANIKYESGYRPEAANKSGTTLGICQWTNGRKANLIALCEQYGLPSDSMEGQCRYLRKELEGSYKKTLAYLQGVEDSAEGAYDAAYYWCCHFEIPSDKESKGNTRGNYAKETLWNKWK